MTNSLPSPFSRRQSSPCQFSQRTTTLALALPSASTMEQLVIAIQHIISTPFLTEREAAEQVVTAVQRCAASNSAATGGHHIDHLQCLSLLGHVSNRIPMPPAILAFARAAFGAPPLPSAAEPAFMAAPPPSFFPGMPSFPTLAYAPPSLLPPGAQVSHGASWPYVTVMAPQLLAQPVPPLPPGAFLPFVAAAALPPAAPMATGGPPPPLAPATAPMMMALPQSFLLLKTKSMAFPLPQQGQVLLLLSQSSLGLVHLGTFHHSPFCWRCFLLMARHGSQPTLMLLSFATCNLLQLQQPLESLGSPFLRRFVSLSPPAPLCWPYKGALKS